MSHDFSRLRLLAAAALFAFAASAQAVTEIQFWHAMTGANNDRINDFAKKFNESQKDYKVNAVFKGSYPEAMAAAIAAYRAGNAPAHPAGVRGRHGDDDVGQGRDQARAPGDGATPARNSIRRSTFRRWRATTRTPRARCCRFRSTARRTVFYYNKDAFVKAGLDPNHAPEDLARGDGRRGQDQGVGRIDVQLHDGLAVVGAARELFSAWHNTAVRDQGERLWRQQSEAAVSTVRCRSSTSSNMQDWAKKGYFTYAGRKNEPEAKFYSGECAMLTSSSAAYANDQAERQVQVRRRAAALLRRRGGRAAEHDHRRRVAVGDGRQVQGRVQGASPSSSSSCRSPEIAGHWHQTTGYLPITLERLRTHQEVRLLREEPRHRRLGEADDRQDHRQNSRGVRLGNFVQIRDIIDEELEACWAGKKTAKEAARCRRRQGQRADREVRQGAKG